MTKEEKQLLLIDLSARLPYEPKARKGGMETNINLTTLDSFYYGDEIILPYIRPMSSMTVEEGERLEQIAKETLGDFMFEAEEDGGAIYHMDKWKTLSPAMFDYLNSIHIDYRGLIGRGLALPAPEGMYDKCETSNI